MRCAACGSLYDANLPGMDRVRCPDCVRRGAPLATSSALVEATPAEIESFKACPACAEPIRERALVCRFCGQDLRRPVGGSRDAPRGPASFPHTLHVQHTLPKSPGLAAILAFFWPGLGHIYAGRIGRGFGVMLLPIACILAAVLGFVATRNLVGVVGVGLLLMLITYFWQIADAYACAQPTFRRPGSHGRRRHGW